MHTYKRAVQFVLKNKSIIIFLYATNLLLALMSMGPLHSYIESVLGKSLAIEEMNQMFDYNLIMDIFNSYKIGIYPSVSAILTFLIIYIFWSVFSSAGILGLRQTNQNSVSAFFAGAIKYFFRFLRIGIYVLIAYAICLVVAYFYFTKDSIHVLKIESEDFLIQRFWIILILLGIIGFFIGLFRDVAKANIVKTNERLIFESNLKSLKNVFKINYISLGLMHILILAIVLIVFFNIRNITCPNIIVYFAVGQIFIIVKIFLRVVRWVSFYEIDEP